MERESFEDNEVANLLNEHFIAIKVDREERPDVDQIYMSVCQTLTGSGGWPLSVFMTAGKKPFYAGTYFPKHDRMGLPGMLTVLTNISSLWDDKKETLLKSSEEILSYISRLEQLQREELEFSVIDEAFRLMKLDFDIEYGGFGQYPKFPTPHNLCFLLRYWYRTKDKTALAMVEKTLECMYNGGIFDHIGYGFSRYSTDRKWLVPHFEKMLYDNALIAIACLETYHITKKQKYSEIARQIFTYTLRDMTSPTGGFFSAEDADSEGVEGKFYVWTMDEIKGILGEEDGEKYGSCLNITQKGNFEGKNIPNMIGTGENAIDIEFFEKCREKLFAYRERRVHPYKDDKILTAWNGLMIAAMAMAGRVLGDDLYTGTAENAVSFINHNLVREDGRLLARYRDGEAAFPAYAEDYAFFIWGLLELYETTFKPEYLERAVKLNDDLLNYFWDNDNGGLFTYGSDSEQLIIRQKEIYDGAIPSANSVACMNFLRLGRLTGNFQLEEKANQLLNAFGKNIKDYPKGYSFALMALLFMESGSKEIVLVAEESNKEMKEKIDIINEEFRPFSISLLCSEENIRIKKSAPFLSNYHTVDGKATVYVCENFSCQAPVTDSGQLKQILQD